jgi:hypothetical protein
MTRLITVPAAALPLTLLVAACATSAPESSSNAPAPASEGAAERLAGDTPRTTVAGNTFIAPAGWSIAVRGPATVVEPPEGGSAIALVDVRAPNADSAVAASGL